MTILNNKKMMAFAIIETKQTNIKKTIIATCGVL